MAYTACRNELLTKTDNLDEIVRNIAMEMFNGAEDFWKILKYQTPDALVKDDLTQAEKSALMTQGDADCRFKFKAFHQADTVTDERTEVRLYIDRIRYISDAEVTVYFGIDLLIHNNIWNLDGGRNRAHILLKDLVSVLNGNRIDKVVGKLDVSGTTTQIRHWDENYLGYKMYITGLTT